MKAINLNKKYALPLMLLGLLALETNWEQFLKAPMMSGEFASSSADVKKRASEICSNSNNDVSKALSLAARQGDAEFYFRGRNEDDLKDKIEVEFEGKKNAADIEYNGTVIIRGIRDDRGSLGPFPRHHVKRNSAILDSFGQNRNNRENPVPKLNPDTNRPYEVTCKLTDDNEFQYRDVGRSGWKDDSNSSEKRCQYPTYRYFEVQVRTETTEGDWCEDCDNESAFQESETRYIEVKVYPEPDSMTNVCEDTFSTAQRLFQETEKDMKESIADQMKEILELAEVEELEEYKEKLEDECRIRPGASLDDIKDYREDRSLDEKLSYAGAPEDKAECLVDNGRHQKGERARQAYFKANTVPFLREQLTSSDAETRSLGQELLASIKTGEMGALNSYERGYLNTVSYYSQQLEQMYRLTAMVERTRGTTAESQWQMQLDTFKNQLNLQLNAQANASPTAFEEASYWHTQITSLNTTAGIVSGTSSTTTDLNQLNYNLAGRGSRLSSGHLPLASEFAAARARISSSPNFMQNRSSYYQGGTDAYERTTYAPSSQYSPTQPPGPERSTGGSRLSRN